MVRTAVYAGTFDPITNGHLDIIERALTIFEHVIVAVGENPSKNPLLSVEERRSLIEGCVAQYGGRVTVDKFGGLLIDFVRKRGAKVIIRGLRAVSDYEYEAQMALINRQLAEEIETVFLMTSTRSAFVSSSIVRQVAKYNGDLAGMVPESVQQKFREMYGSSSGIVK